MAELDHSVELVLLEAGWSKGRRAGTEALCSKLSDSGYFVSQSAREFLDEFSGLHLRFPNPRKRSIMIGYALGSVLDWEFLGSAWIHRWEKEAGESLCPVGTDDRGYGVVLVGSTGSLYAGFDSSLSRLADSTAEGLRVLMQEQEWTRIPIVRREPDAAT